jgi:hypothetical protein
MIHYVCCRLSRPSEKQDAHFCPEHAGYSRAGLWCRPLRKQASLLQIEVGEIKGIAGLPISHPAREVVNPVGEVDSRHETKTLLNLGDIGEAMPDVSLPKRALDLRLDM